MEHAAHVCARVISGEEGAERTLLSLATSYDSEMRQAVTLAAASVVLGMPADEAWRIGARASWLRLQRARAEGRPEAMGHPVVDVSRWNDAGRKLHGACAVGDPGPDDASRDDAELIEAAAAGAEGAELDLVRRVAFLDAGSHPRVDMGHHPRPAFLAFVLFHDCAPLSAADLRVGAEHVESKLKRATAA